MFAPLLEPGDARDGHVVLQDPGGRFRKFALRVGMFMADIPEICRMLGRFGNYALVFDHTHLQHRCFELCDNQVPLLQVPSPQGGISAV
jgi:hypothetical protein